jgi:ABC-type sugar transport system ATPase subunit
VDLAVRPGTIHGLVGENGSGKSTLVKIVAGVLGPDAGELEIDGKRRRLRSPAAASRLGIGVVFQEVLVSPARSVLENIFLGVDGLLRTRDAADRRERAAAVLARISEATIDLDAAVESLPLSHQQAVVIARALVREPRVLVLDEATSALDVADSARLFAECRRLRADGRAIVFISHRLEELLALADEVSVIRDGESVGVLARATATSERILELMTGDARRPGHEPQRRAGVAASEAPPLVVARGVSVGAARDVDLEVAPGELLGLAGLEGHGQDDLLAGLGGVRAPRAGEVLATLDGETASIGSRFDAARRRILYLPRNRARQGILPALGVLTNFSLPTLAQDGTLGVFRRRGGLARLRAAQGELGIRFASPESAITELSGGNQQKVLLARWLAAGPRVLLLDDPTRGVDLPTKRDIHALLRRLAEGGVAVVAVSTELEELEEVCDRVAVFHEGRIAAVLTGEEIERGRIAAAMFGAA